VWHDLVVGGQVARGVYAAGVWLRRRWSPLRSAVPPWGILWKYDDLLSVDGSDSAGVLITQLFVKGFNRSFWDSIRLDEARLCARQTGKVSYALVEADGKHLPLSEVNAVPPRCWVTLVFPLGKGLREMEFVNQYGDCQFEAVYEMERHTKRLRTSYLESLLRHAKRLLYPKGTPRVTPRGKPASK
jgi:hypothetical protein